MFNLAAARIGVMAAVGLGLLAGMARAETRDGMLIHVRAGAQEPRAIQMALHMAELMAEDHPVLVYFDLDGVEAVARRPGEPVVAELASALPRIERLVKRGVPLRACPACLQARGLGDAQLLKGVGLADKSEFFRFTEGRILTLDY